MPETYRDSFTDSAGVDVTSRPTPTGGLTWAAASQLNSSVFSASGTGNLSVSIDQQKSLSVDVGTTDHYAEITYPAAQSGHPLGAGVRINGHSDGIYLRAFGTDNWQIVKRVGGVNAQVGSYIDPGAGSGLRPSAGAHTIRIAANGSSPTTIKVYVDGTQIGTIAGYTVSDAGAVQTSTRCGICGYGSGANHIAEAAGGSLATGDAITITSPETVIQAVRSGPTTVSFSGTYTGTVTSIEARVEDFTTGVALSGLDWATVVASPSGGTYSFNRALPAGANYRVRVRFSNNTAITAATGAVFGVGVCIAIFGQSNALAMNSGAATPNTHVHYFSDATFSKPTGSGGTIALANKINELTGLPVAISAYGVVSTNLSNLLAGTNWSNFVAQVDGKPSGFADCVLIQGEADATSSPTVSGRKATLDTLLTQMASAGQTTTGNMRIWIGQIGTNTGDTADGTSAADGWEIVRTADHQKCDEHASFELAAHLIDIAHDADGLHYTTTDAGYLEIGRRIGRSIAKGWGASTYDGLGPRATGATIAGSTVTVTFNLNGHGALTGTGNLTGWQYSTDGGASWVLASGVTRSGNTISFTAAGATHVRHLANANPTVTTLLRGDAKADALSPANLPVAPTTGGYVAVGDVPTLTGASSLVFTASGALTGSGTLTGASGLAFSTAGVASATGALTGAATVLFTPSGVLSGTGSLAGAAALVFATSGTLIEVAPGDMAGTAALAFVNAGTLSATGALAGTAALQFTPFGSLTATGALAGAAALTFSTSGALTAVSGGDLSGAVALTIATAGTLSATGALAGTAALQFTPFGSLTATGALAGAAALTFSTSGALTAVSGGDLSGAVALTIATAGTLTGSGSLTGATALTFAATGTLSTAGEIIANSRRILTPSARARILTA